MIDSGEIIGRQPITRVFCRPILFRGAVAEPEATEFDALAPSSVTLITTLRSTIARPRGRSKRTRRCALQSF